MGHVGCPVEYAVSISVVCHVWFRLRFQVEFHACCHTVCHVILSYWGSY